MAGRTSLVVVESPTKVKTIQKYLDHGFVVKASLGHLKDLPKSKLGIDVKKGFAPQYVPVRTKTKTLEELKRPARRPRPSTSPPTPTARARRSAGTSPRSSSLLPDKVYRVLFNEITEKAVKAAFKDPGRIDQKRVDAQQARRVLDRLVGYKISPLLWERDPPGPVGRAASSRSRSASSASGSRRSGPSCPRSTGACTPTWPPPCRPSSSRASARRTARSSFPPTRPRRRPVVAELERYALRGQGGRPGRAPQEPVAAVHHVDAPAGRRPEAPLLGVQDHDGRPAALRGRRDRERRARSASSPTCGPTRRGWPPRPRIGGPRRDRGPVRG